MGKGTVRSRRVEAMRKRKAELDDARVRAEQRVDQALVSYAAAAEALEELAAKADTHRVAQAEALQTMRDNGRPLDEIATMVDLPSTEVRRLTRPPRSTPPTNGDQPTGQPAESTSSAAEPAIDARSPAAPPPVPPTTDTTVRPSAATRE